MAELIAVTGATGSLGGRVARLLTAAGRAQRLVVRDPARAPAIGAEVAQAEYGDADALRAAFAGVSTLFFVSAAEGQDQLAQHVSVVDAAVAAGVRRVVYTSYLGASPAATHRLATQHWATEESIRESGLDFTFLRDSMYADSAPLLVGDDLVIRGPAGNGRASLVSQDDIARCAAAVLVDPADHEAAAYTLTGPEALSLAEIAERLSRLTGRSVLFHDETEAEAWASRASSGAPDWLIEGWVASYLAIAAGELATVTDDVRTLTGRRPESLERCLTLHPEALARIRGASLDGSTGL